MANDRLIRNAEIVARRARSSADNFNIEAARVQNRKHLLDFLSVSIGVIALFMTVFPPFKKITGDIGSEFLTIFAASFLILQHAVEKYYIKLDPDRLKDYGLYLAHCSEGITDVLLNDKFDDIQLGFWVKYANLNLHDASSKFPSLVSSLISEAPFE
jgi:hypothetical protein